MKKAVLTLILFDLLMVDLIFLSMVSSKMATIAFTVIVLCFWGLRLSWVIFALWFFWPYIKRGFNYLVNHRED